MRYTAHVGMRSPQGYVTDLVPSTNGEDLSTVTAAVLQAQRPDGTVVTWAATLSNKTTTTITVSHVYASDGSDLNQQGVWSVFAQLTLPGGSIDSDPIPLFVSGPFVGPNQ